MTLNLSTDCTSCLSSIILSPFNSNVKCHPMNRETVTSSQKELRRVEVISRCVQGNLARANRGRPRHRRLPQPTRQAILRHTAQAWRPAPHDLQRIWAFLHERVVSNDNVVQWDGHGFQIPPQNRRFSFAGAKVQLLSSSRWPDRPLLRRHPSRARKHHPTGVTFCIAVRGDRIRLLQYALRDEAWASRRSSTCRQFSSVFYFDTLRFFTYT